ncbi:MAG: phosphoribosylanthranilate isomerase [Saprospiraceae bacterium]|jgi:phosphoribosylanthranilate isomerase
MLKISVKASQITNLTDARYFAAREVEWLGFNLDTGTENAIPPQQISAIKEWVEGPKIVGEFGLQSPDEIKVIAEYLELDAIQIGLFADTESIRKVLDIPILKEIVIENEDFAGVQPLIESLSSMVEIFIFDLVKNGIKWSDLSSKAIALLKSLCAKNKILFNIDLTLEELPLFMAQIHPLGLVLLGDEEEKVGYKSFDELDEILDFLEIEE